MKYTKEDIILDFINTFAGFNAKVIDKSKTNSYFSDFMGCCDVV